MAGAQRGKSHASKLVSLVLQSGAELFHSPDGDPYLTVNGETFGLRGPDTRSWLSRQYVRATGSVPTSSAITDALASLCGSAINGPEHPVFTRVAAIDQTVTLDLGRPHGVVEISADGWQVKPTSVIRFKRRRGFLPLPVPVRSESRLEDLLATFLNVRDTDDLRLFIAWDVGALRGRKPYPILSITGENGSAKSSACRYARRLVDPNTADSRLTPKDVRDLMIAAANAHVIVYENLTRIEDWLADGMCCLSTGAGFATRTLTTDLDETIISAARPIIINAIKDIVNRPDLLDRTLTVMLNPIPDDQRLTEDEVEQRFVNAHPIILGRLLDAVSCALKNEPTTRPKSLPRMADFARTISAAEPALGWSEGAFLAAYSENRDSAIETRLEGDAVAGAIRRLQRPWTGTAEELRQALTTPELRASEHWPKTAKGMSNAIRGLTEPLRRVGIDVQFLKRTHGVRRIEIRDSSIAMQGPLSYGDVPEQRTYEPPPF